MCRRQLTLLPSPPSRTLSFQIFFPRNWDQLLIFSSQTSTLLDCSSPSSIAVCSERPLSAPDPAAVRRALSGTITVNSLGQATLVALGPAPSPHIRVPAFLSFIPCSVVGAVCPRAKSSHVTPREAQRWLPLPLSREPTSRVTLPASSLVSLPCLPLVS